MAVVNRRYKYFWRLNRFLRIIGEVWRGRFVTNSEVRHKVLGPRVRFSKQALNQNRLRLLGHVLCIPQYSVISRLESLITCLAQQAWLRVSEVLLGTVIVKHKRNRTSSAALLSAYALRAVELPLFKTNGVTHGYVQFFIVKPCGAICSRLPPVIFCFFVVKRLFMAEVYWFGVDQKIFVSSYGRLYCTMNRRFMMGCEIPVWSFPFAVWLFGHNLPIELHNATVTPSDQRGGIMSTNQVEYWPYARRSGKSTLAQSETSELMDDESL